MAEDAKPEHVEWIPQPTPTWWERVGQKRWEELHGPLSGFAATLDRDAVRMLSELPPDTLLATVIDSYADDLRTAVIWSYVDEGLLTRSDTAQHAIERLMEQRRRRVSRRRHGEHHR